MERKDFLKKSIALCGLSMIPGALIESCTKQTYSGPTNVNFTLDLTSSANAALNTVGGSLVSNSILIIRTSASTFSAFSSICTHQGCTVSYNKAQTDIVCPCHGGIYDLNGNVVSGPPPSALTKYTVTRSGNTLTVKS